jgi:hypothetical protein
MPKGVFEREPLADRFFRYVEKTEGCWNWVGGHFTNGYGKFSVKHKNNRAHRVSYELANGTIPEGLVVRHTCDNRRCVNPAHLITGTHEENMRDMTERERQARGENQGSVKLTEEQVKEIRAIGNSQRQVDIAEKYGIKQGQVGKILRKVNWKHIPE